MYPYITSERESNDIPLHVKFIAFTGLTLRARTGSKFFKKCWKFCCTGVLHSSKLVHLDDRAQCVKSIRIWIYTGPHFSAPGLNNSEYEHFSCSEYDLIYLKFNVEFNELLELT